MKRIIFIIVFLFLGLVSQAQVFYSNDLTNTKDTKNFPNSYIEVTVNTDLGLVCINLCGERVFFKLIDAQISQDGDFTKLTYVIEGNNQIRYTFYVVGTKNGSTAIVLPDFDLIGQHAKFKELWLHLYSNLEIHI